VPKLKDKEIQARKCLNVLGRFLKEDLSMTEKKFDSHDRAFICRSDNGNEYRVYWSWAVITRYDPNGAIFNDADFFVTVNKVEENAWVVRTAKRKNRETHGKENRIWLDDDDLGDPIPLNPGLTTDGERKEKSASNVDSHNEWLYFKTSEVDALVNSIKTKPFVILAGISGTGKTQLARTVADELVNNQVITWAHEDGYYRVKMLTNTVEDKISFTPVRPDWTDNKKIWGYLNPLEEIDDGSKRKLFYATDILRLLIRAQSDSENDYFIILDEMNLARVEYYFSDILSLMESSGEEVNLHSEGNNVVDAKDRETQIKPNITFPKNVKIIGTVNVDETTFAFAPKVLDRAFVLEFLDADYGLLLQSPSDEKVLEFCNKLKRILEPINLHFGYRTVKEMKAFIGNTSNSDPEEHFDFLLKAKVLTKLHGTISDLENPLKELLQLCLKPGKKLEDYQESKEKNDEAKYPESAKKIDSMLRRLEGSGFTSFF
jgi:5-methylcytosine-specific restriction enzyme B